MIFLNKRWVNIKTPVTGNGKEKTMHMYVSFNFLISIVAFTCAIFLHRKTSKYHNVVGFMIFFGMAAGIGGIVHAIELYEMDTLNSFTNWINNTFYSVLSEKVSSQGILSRLWLITVMGIGFSEYYFMWIFFEPLMQGKFIFIKHFLRASLILYLVAVVISSQYIAVVAFHVYSHVIVIILTIYLIIKHNIMVYISLLGLLILNLGSGLMQQLMKNGVIPIGPLHYNDWYHISISLLLALTYLLVTKGKIIEHIEEEVRKSEK